jgi:hypothetical protein
VTDGDDRVNARDGLDETATAIAAPAMAARTPRVIRRGIMVSSRLPNDLNVLADVLFKMDGARFGARSTQIILSRFRARSSGCPRQTHPAPVMDALRSGLRTIGELCRKSGSLVSPSARSAGRHYGCRVDRRARTRSTGLGPVKTDRVGVVSMPHGPSG